MTHLDDAVLVAFRDGALEAEGRTGVTEHLAECERCRTLLTEIQERRPEVEAALRTLDVDFDMESARSAVRARLAVARREDGVIPLDDAGSRRASPGTGWWSLSRAAGLVLVAATAASALPGSPVRSWIEGALDSDGAQSATVESAEPATAPAATLAEEGTGIRLSVPTGPLRVEIVGLPDGAELVVRWMPGTEVAVLAPQGSAFSSSDGRITATVGAGPVEVQLPREVRPAVIEVGGRTYLRYTGEGVDVTGPAVERTDAFLRFLVPGR